MLENQLQVHQEKEAREMRAASERLSAQTVAPESSSGNGAELADHGAKRSETWRTE